MFGREIEITQTERRAQRRPPGITRNDHTKAHTALTARREIERARDDLRVWIDAGTLESGEIDEHRLERQLDVQFGTWRALIA